MLPIKRALVLAAHPDDEVLGCGGTIARLSSTGIEVQVLFFTNGVSARHLTLEADAAAVQRRRAESRAACELLGVTSVTELDYPDNGMDQVSILTVAKALSDVALKFKPDIVFSHHPGDVNVDHRRVSEAAEIAFRPSSDFNVRCIYFFETLSSSEWNITRPLQSFTPNTYINIDDWLEQKILALRAYESELRSYPHPRSPEGLTSQANWRGLAAGFRSAEAFSVGRQVLP